MMTMKTKITLMVAITTIIKLLIYNLQNQPDLILRMATTRSSQSCNSQNSCLAHAFISSLKGPLWWTRSVAWLALGKYGAQQLQLYRRRCFAFADTRWEIIQVKALSARKEAKNTRLLYRWTNICGTCSVVTLMPSMSIWKLFLKESKPASHFKRLLSFLAFPVVTRVILLVPVGTTHQSHKAKVRLVRVYCYRTKYKYTN